MQILLATYVIVGVIFIVVAVPLIKRWVKPNFFYGFRLPQTMANADLWYEVNSYSGKLLAGVGVATILAALLCYALNFGRDSYTLACTGVMLLGILTMLALSVRRMITFNRK